MSSVNVVNVGAAIPGEGYRTLSLPLPLLLLFNGVEGNVHNVHARRNSRYGRRLRVNVGVRPTVTEVHDVHQDGDSGPSLMAGACWSSSGMKHRTRLPHAAANSRNFRSLARPLRNPSIRPGSL